MRAPNRRSGRSRRREQLPPLTDRFGINGDADHGALIELGLDYTSFNFNDTSMGVYARTRVVIWGERGTSWQVQGGLSFRF